MNIVSQQTPTTGEKPIGQAAYVAPYVDITATDSGYVLYAEMPGVSREGIEITFEDGNLTIAGRRQTLAASGEPVHRETRQLDFRRVYKLDTSIDANRISARIEQGILTVNLPKSEDLKPRRIALD